MSEELSTIEELADPRWRGRIFIVSGPSGVGKSVLVERLLADDASLVRAVTATTREPAPRERDGIDYHFVSVDRFKRWIARGALLEYVEFCGNYYGTPVASVIEPLRNGKTVILVIEVQGTLKVKGMIPTLVSVFIAPPGIEELERRIRKRRRDDPEAIQRRLTRAREELRQAEHYDFTVVNDSIPEAVAQLRHIIAPANRTT